MSAKLSQSVIAGFEASYEAGLGSLHRSKFRQGIAYRYGSDLIEDAYQQAALEHWKAATEGRLPRSVFDGERFDVENEHRYLLSRTNLRLGRRAAEARREPLLLDAGWNEGTSSDNWVDTIDDVVLDERLAEALDSSTACERILTIAHGAAPHGATVLALVAEGFEHEEIAVLIGISANYSRQILFRVRIELRAEGYGA